MSRVMTAFFCHPQPKEDSTKGVSSLYFNYHCYQVRELFLKGLGISQSCDQLEFQDFLDKCNLNDAINLGHQVLRSREFDDIFHIMLDELTGIYGPLAYQARPTFRIQKVGTRSVPFHTDDISSGHPSHIINVWIPLVDLDSENTLHFVDEHNTHRIKQDFVSGKKSINWITQEADPISQAWIGRYGQIVLFSNNTLHGTRINTTSSRASIDFRILPLNKSDSMNRKKLGSDYLVFNKTGLSPDIHNAQQAASSHLAVSLIYSNASAAHLSHSLQRSIVDEFASNNSFEICRETAEWQTSHYAIIEEILDMHPDMAILFSSKLCFMVNDQFTEEFCRLFQKLKMHPSPVWFCFENIRLN